MGPQRADLLKKELGIFTFKDLLEHYPLRHLDKTKVDKINNLNYTSDYAQVAGKLISSQTMGEKQSKRLVAYLQDGTGEIELTWFQGISWVQKILESGQQYLVFGKVTFFNNKVQMVHPELEIYTPEKATGKSFLDPIYPSTEKLKVRGMNGRAIAKLTYA
jgi:ATP-dependent DNA helicase RecG